MAGSPVLSLQDYTLSTRAKEAVKTGLAMVIVFAIAMQLGWDKPYYAGLAVATISLNTTGVSLTRGAIRSSVRFMSRTLTSRGTGRRFA